MTQLNPNRFKACAAEYERNIHVIIPEVDTPIEAITDPGYWAHVSQYLKVWDRIEIKAEDGSYFAELIVLSAGRLYANVAVLRHVTYTPVTPGAIENTPQGFAVKYRGAIQKWSVVRDEFDADGKVTRGKDVIKEGYDTEIEARTWLASHIKTIAAPKVITKAAEANVQLPAKAAGAKADTSL